MPLSRPDCPNPLFMASETNLRYPVKFIDVEGLAIRFERVRLNLGAHAGEPFLMTRSDLRDALGLL